MKIWKVILAALVIFGAGVVTGGLTVRLRPHAGERLAQPRVMVPPGPLSAQRRGEYMARLQRELRLTPTQRANIEQALRESQERVGKLWEPLAPVAKQESHRIRDRIRAELTPAQIARFDQLKGRAPLKPNGPYDERRRREERLDPRAYPTPPADKEPAK